MEIYKKALAIVVMMLPISIAHAQTGLEQLSEVSKASSGVRTNTTGVNLGDLLKTVEEASADNKVNHCGEDLRCWYISNKFLGKNKVLTLDSNNTLMMQEADYTNPRQMWEIVKDNNGYFRLHSAAHGTSKCIDSDKNRPDLRNCGNYSGQYWKLTDQGDWLRISNMYQKEDRVLDTYNAPGNRVFFESKSRNTSGTFWKIRSLPWSLNTGRLVE